MGHCEYGSQGSFPLYRLYAIIALQDFQNYQDDFFPILNHFLHCPCDLSM